MRLKSLDALRGLAALSIVASHCLLAAGAGWDWSHPLILMPIAYGRPAVIIFFVLSGFVLSLAFFDEAPPSYAAYLMRRFCRLYLPFAAAISFAALAYAATAHIAIAIPSDWVKINWNVPLTPSLFVAHLEMTGVPWQTSLDDVMWSLVHEFRISIVFPLLVILVRRNSFYAMSASLLFGFASEQAFRLFGSGPPGWPVTASGDPFTSFLATAYFVSFFVAGITMAKHRVAISRRLRAWPKWLLLALFVAAWAAFAWPLQSRFADVFYGPAACLVIALAIAVERTATVLESAPLLWLGKVSYSLYLFHVPILLAMLHLFYGRAPLPLILTAAVVAALAFSEIAYRVIEAPATKLGRRLTTTPRTQPAEAA